MFEPKAVIFPSSDNDAEILISGSVAGKARNVTITDEKLGQEFRTLIEVRDAAHDAANEKFAAGHALLSDDAFAAAITKYDAENAPKVEE